MTRARPISLPTPYPLRPPSPPRGAARGLYTPPKPKEHRAVRRTIRPHRRERIDMPVFDPLPDAPGVGDLPLHFWDGADFTVVPWPADTWEIGYNSHTWLLERDGDRAVLKAVPKAYGVKFASGLRAAEMAERAGIPSGAPRRTRDGAVVAEHGDWCWGLLEHLDGRPTDTDNPTELALAGRALGSIHASLRTVPPLPETMVWSQMDWLLEPQPFLAGLDWIQQAIREGFAALPANLSDGIIHCDPRLTEFRFDGDKVGLLDWGEVMHGPHMLDVASTLSFAEEEIDTTPFLTGYLETSPASPEEYAYLPTMLKMRAAIEGWIYARRRHFDVDLGQTGEHTNDTLIERARENIAAADALPKDHYLL
ncbi:phosphotransferase [Streptomyces sp. NPDC045470]|uniref:phosphotransferase enzyme family protein n=1 Tax=Streptomyces sp. NPDC045470 TaxID=3155469 RepID=UPI0033CF09AE